MAATQTLARYALHLKRFAEVCKDDPCLTPLRTFRYRRVEVYMRCCWYLMSDEAYLCLDIARVEVWPQRRGTFKELLTIAQDLCPWNAVRVESVGNPHLARYLRRLLSEDDRWLEEGRSDCPNFIWFRDRDGHYMSPGLDGIENSTSARERLRAMGSEPSLFNLLATSRDTQPPPTRGRTSHLLLTGSSSREQPQIPFNQRRRGRLD